MKQGWKNRLFNSCIALNGVLLVVLLFGNTLQPPPILQVMGRMHPLTLHFPIVVLLIAFAWELLVPMKKQPVLVEAGDWLLLAGAFSAVLASLMGLFLSKEEGYDSDAIAWHKWTGVLIAFIGMGWYALRSITRRKKITTLAAGTLAMVSIVVAGHQGATITHGENFLLAPVTPEKIRPKVLLEDALAYTHLVKPILEDKCMSCHNNTKAKGELVMTTEDLLRKGGKTGKLWDSTADGFGLMMKRVHLPSTSKEHMPPTGKPQLTDEEINALYYWIKSGASFTKKILEYAETDTLRTIAAGFFNTLENDEYDFAAADEATVKKLNTDYRVVNPLALNSPALAVEFFGISLFRSDQIKDLEKIKNNIVSLSLNKMPVTDGDLKQIALFKNLRKLNLSFTDITGATLSELSKLTDLRQLSVSGTKVKAANLGSLRNMKKLSSLYIWNTDISENEMVQLKKSFTSTIIETGFNGDTIIARLNAPIIEGEKQLFTANSQVKIKHYIKGVTIRYTMDGSEPDSTLSPIYKDSIMVSRSCLLKIKAFLPGWISSELAMRNFYKIGFIADSVRLVTQPNPIYAASGAKTLSDGEKGELNFRDGKWLGYKENDLQAYLYFKEPVSLSSVSFSTVVDIGSYIMPAQQLEVWGGTSVSNLVLLKKMNPKQPSMQESPYMFGFDCTFDIRKVGVLKIIAKPVKKMPAWHPGKGSPAWVFVDEIFLN
jgi:uncharacterized membrane protein/Leucine-rich repeat (LRR) protein